ncbi:hypothetical protein HMPREF9372_0969 [Sporosarcina newyorkensis 2681]|uniref:6-hydroxymethylpterin diphosphokinase MptE-like domain-containing protein n=1 Tax=Sporosarcina newyorkensis 2681 TaxID=1027292 RepID=F9DQ89_9BACL|nr:6-hydroxymethylpterin diphosphokinase MptE-like protein [Sporosarcina newyorkensis]EGQ26939.1 hypothetical protein HMPREF9372_0969 [Sporosarcina newyorkensis 2681]
MKADILDSKSGLPTLQLEYGGRKIFIHSKYDPVKEATQLLERYKEQIENHQHILFYGVGLGYHVKAFIEQYPEKLVSTYEPVVEVAAISTSVASETKFDQSQLRYLFVEQKPADVETHLQTLSHHLTQKVLLIILPSYERFLKEEILQFLVKFKEIVEEKKQNMGTNVFFSKRWTVNALMNLPSTFETPNFLLEHAETFRDKPVLLVAAGPSLSEEMENLRIIKARGLAYIFAVGSANKALIANGIHPDAVFTYDPQAHNYTVFQPIMNEEIATIPMIYGTTVGFETIQMYPGPKMHFVTAQDTITQQFHETELPVINDAYSIAIVTMEILYRLQVKNIILVGQNFAFKNDLFYSKEIQRYDKGKREISDASVQEKDKEDAFYVKDVYGNDILTTKGFNNMRKSMVRYIAKNPDTPVINTTRGGAEIEGTTFVPLSEVMKEQLKKKVVEENWYTKGEVLPTTNETKNKLKVLQQSLATYREQDLALYAHFKEVEQSIANLNLQQLQKRFEKTDELVGKLTSNMIYDVAIRPITRNALETLQAEVELLRKMEISKEKLVIILNLFAAYFNRCRVVYKEIAPVVQTCMISQFLYLNGQKQYIATSGVFQFEGEWEKHFSPVDVMPFDLTEEEKFEWREKIALLDRIELPITGVRTTKRNASFAFLSSGTSLALYGTNHSKGSIKLRIIIDNKISNITIKERIDEELFGTNARQLLFQTTTLKDQLHHIKVEVISEDPDILFEGIKIDQSARAYHIDEVEKVDELAIGMRIRCHYKASYNTVGEFGRLGQETKSFLPVESSPNPDGDFYFIMVDVVDEEKKLIADRNLQNYISWMSLNEFIQTTTNQIILNQQGDTTGRIELLSGGSPKKEQVDQWKPYIYGADLETGYISEWDKYIVQSDRNNSIIPGSEFFWNWGDKAASWTNTKTCYKNLKGVPMMPVRSKVFAYGNWRGEGSDEWILATIENKLSIIAFRPQLLF